MCMQCVKKISEAEITTLIERNQGERCSTLANLITSSVRTQMGKCPAMRELEGLTPGGSEFYEDPKRCAETILGTRTSLMKQFVEKVKRVNVLEDTLKTIAALIGKNLAKED